MAFFCGKIRCQKLAKSKANPLPKCQFSPKNGHFWRNFFQRKNVCKWPKMKGNSLKWHFYISWGFLGHFLVEKLGVKNWPKVRLTPYQNANLWPNMAILLKLFSAKKRLEIA